jgi:antagonist of KipI
MDPRSHRLANALVGNDQRAATLEITLVGPELAFDDERLVAVAGARFAIEIDGRRLPMHTAVTVGSGSRVRIGERSVGARGYLAVSGGFDVPAVLGSRSTHMLTRMGGVAGRALTAGDRIALGPVKGSVPSVSAEYLPRLPQAGSDTRIRVLAGPHHERFVGDALETLQSAPYSVQNESDRMGFRLAGPPLRHRAGADIISDATPLGVLQVPASGQPVLLMADRQTTGGYPALATVISADIGLVGQLAPGDRLRFEVCQLSDALAALIKQEQALMSLEAAVGR